MPLFALPHADDTRGRARLADDLALGARLAEFLLGLVAPFERRVERRQPVAMGFVGEELSAPLTFPLDAHKVAEGAFGRVVDPGDVLVFESTRLAHGLGSSIVCHRI